MILDSFALDRKELSCRRARNLPALKATVNFSSSRKSKVIGSSIVTFLMPRWSANEHVITCRRNSKRHRLVLSQVCKKGKPIMDKERLLAIARDLRKIPPRSPRETLGGFVIAARMLDKARGDLLGINGEYNFYPRGLGAYFWKLPDSRR